VTDRAGHACQRAHLRRPTRDHPRRRIEQGRTEPEIIGILERYTAREVYPTSKQPSSSAEQDPIAR
jgi:hypothetical protein